MPLSIDKNYFLLDTCIAEYWLDKDMQSAIATQMSSWAGDVFDLAISEISYAELVDGAYKEKVERVKDLLGTYTRFEVTQRVLTGAGILSSIYQSFNPKTSGACIEDKIIAATSFIYNIPVITADIHDYPHPFFVTIESENIKYQKKGKDRYITIDILKPNTKILRDQYSRMP